LNKKKKKKVFSIKHSLIKINIIISNFKKKKGEFFFINFKFLLIFLKKIK